MNLIPGNGDRADTARDANPRNGDIVLNDGIAFVGRQYPDRLPAAGTATAPAAITVL
jgi:hypothetical protein